MTKLLQCMSPLLANVPIASTNVRFRGSLLPLTAPVERLPLPRSLSAPR